MKESFQVYGTSSRTREFNEMSSVPLMTLHSSKRGAEETRDSDQMSEEDDDPLESVLARMKYRPQSYRSQDFWSSVIFSGVLSFIIGFVVSYILFLSIDQNNKILQIIEHDADPEIASTILKEISAHEIRHFLRDLNISHTDNMSQDYKRALTVREHFVKWGFDTVSDVFSSNVTLLFYDETKPNLVKIVESDKGESDRNLKGIQEHYIADEDIKNSSPIQNLMKGAVVYVNFGRESDFQYLRENRSDVSVKGFILLVRVGKVQPVELVWRCLEKGALGVILFADPQQYPASMTRNKNFLSPADLGRLQDMYEKLAAKGGSTASCLPVQTISSSDALYLFREMSSSEPTPDSWKGNMSLINYSIGPGLSDINNILQMEVSMRMVTKTCYSVTGGLRGNHEPDRYVLLGSSHTSFSGKDTSGATASMMEVARVLSKLNSNTGWRPRRSIIFCSWGFSSDEGSITSMPLTEDWLVSMHQKAVVYLGVEVAVVGNKSISIAATPLLSRLAYDASSLVPNPSPTAVTTHMRTVFDSWLNSSAPSSGPRKPRILNVEGDGNFQSILKDVGIPSLDVHYGGTEVGERIFNDTDLRYHKAITQMWALMTWKTADGLVIPFDVNQYSSYLKESVKAISKRYKKEVEKYSLPMQHLQYAVGNFSAAADTFYDKIEHLDKTSSLIMRIMNDQQMQLERAFLHHHRSPGSLKPRHMLFSSGASRSMNPDLGLGNLQDMLDDLSTSPVVDVVRNNIELHIESLVHCIFNAAHNLEVPFQPPALAV